MKHANLQWNDTEAKNWCCCLKNGHTSDCYDDSKAAWILCLNALFSACLWSFCLTNYRFITRSFFSRIFFILESQQRCQFLAKLLRVLCSSIIVIIFASPSVVSSSFFDRTLGKRLQCLLSVSNDQPFSVTGNSTGNSIGKTSTSNIHSNLNVMPLDLPLLASELLSCPSIAFSYFFF